MRSIGEFLSRIRNKQAQEIFLRSTIQTALKTTLAIDADIDAIEFKGGAVLIKGLSQTAKSALYMKKGSLLKEIAKLLPTRAVNDVKAY